jgi:hypothetical protein
MRDARLTALASRQFNRVSRSQLLDLGLTADAIAHRLAVGRLVIVEQGVFALPPPLDDDRGRWMGATLTAPGTVLSHLSAACAWGILSRPRSLETVTRPGSGGPRRHGGVLVHRSSTLGDDVTRRWGIPITSVSRTLLDLASKVGDRALARAVRESVRLELTTLPELGERLGGHRGRRGVRRLAWILTRYAGLPLDRARSGAEVRALEILQAAGRSLPRLNVRIAGEEADLSWRSPRLIIEIDGGPFHLDRGEDARKQRAWEEAGWEVRRISSDDIYDRPERLLTLSPPPNVPRSVP